MGKLPETNDVSDTRLKKAFQIHNWNRVLNELPPIDTDNQRIQYLRKIRLNQMAFIATVRDGYDVTKFISKQVKARDALVKRQQENLNKKLARSEPIVQQRRFTKDGWVYVIVNAAFPGWVKIGSSFNLDGRLSTYQTYTPTEKYEIVGKVFSKDRVALELSIHEKLKDHRGNGEWFKIDLPIALAYLHGRKVRELV